MKVGLLTVHCSLNYGAVLQATALYETIKNIAEETEVINFRYPPFCSIVDKTRSAELKKPKNLLRRIVKGRMINKKKKAFDSFLSQHIDKLTDECNSYDDLVKLCKTKDYDVYICGSDQIWNPYNIRFEKSFFLRFANPSAKKISYAASIGQEQIGTDALQFISENIDAINTISVREESAVEILRQAGVTKPISVNLDPVFFLSKKDWEKKQIAVDYPKGFSSYILVYRLTNNPLMDKVLKELTEKTGLPCVAITERMGKIPYISKKYSSVGPGEFIYLINNADYVVTDSFHGIAFSILFEKKLIAISNLNRNTRILNLLEKMKMKDCLVNQEKTENLLPEINYTDAYLRCRGIIDEERNRNMDYLRKEVIV